MLASTGLFWFGLNGVIVLTPLWVVSYLGRDEGVVSQLLSVFIIVDLLFFFVFNALAHRVGKYVLMQVTYLTGGLVIAMFALIGFLPLGNEFVQTLAVVALFGIPAAGFTVLPFAALSDVVDYDERLTGRRREAVYFGVMGMGQKVMIGLSVLSFTIVPYLYSDGTQVLRDGGGLRFTATYTRADGAPVEPPTDSSESRHREPGTVRVLPVPAGVPAKWTLTGPNGYTREGRGQETVSGLAPGKYAVSWHDAPAWTAPGPPRLPTPLGLKLMAVLCGVFCVGGFLVFLRYPIREKDGKAYIVNAT
jgi:MFS family permease